MQDQLRNNKEILLIACGNEGSDESKCSASPAHLMPVQAQDGFKNILNQGSATSTFSSSSNSEQRALIQAGFAFSVQVKEMVYEGKQCKMLVFRDQTQLLNQINLCMRCSSLKHFTTRLADVSSNELTTHLHLANALIEHEHS